MAVEKGKTKEYKYGLHKDMVQADFHDPYIVSGYRKPNLTAYECIQSTFVISCNESFNILSHLCALVYLAVKYYRVFTTELSIRDPLYWPLFCQAVGLLGFCFMSAMAHMFNSMSSCARNRCFFLDYAAISVYSVGAGLAFYHYERPLQSHTRLLDNTGCFILVSVATSFMSTYICCQSRSKWISVKYIVRTLAYVVPFFVNSFPYFYRLLSCDNELDCDNRHLPVYLKHALVMLIAALANMTKFPERLIPGKFDAFGQSHHVMHILLPLGCDMKFEFLRLEILTRKNTMLEHSIQANFSNTLLPMFIAIFVNLLIAMYSQSEPKKQKST